MNISTKGEKATIEIVMVSVEDSIPEHDSDLILYGELIQHGGCAVCLGNYSEGQWFPEEPIEVLMWGYIDDVYDALDLIMERCGANEESDLCADKEADPDDKQNII